MTNAELGGDEHNDEDQQDYHHSWMTKDELTKALSNGWAFRKDRNFVDDALQICDQRRCGVITIFGRFSIALAITVSRS